MTRTCREVVTIFDLLRGRGSSDVLGAEPPGKQKLTNSSMPVRTAPKARRISEYTCTRNFLVIVIILCCYKNLKTIIIVCVVFLFRKCSQSNTTAWLMLYHMLKHKAGNLFKTCAFQAQNTYLEHAQMCIGFLSGIIRQKLEGYRKD